MEAKPQVVWQEDNVRIVQRDDSTLLVETMHRDSIGNEAWSRALPDTEHDVVVRALVAKLKQEAEE
jgi:hypothetical protein